jgi:phosphoglycerate kinase
MPTILQLPYGEVELPTLDDVDPAGRRVLVRVDFNVPLADGEVSDDTRLRAALPTITELVDGGGAVVLMSHLGRPKGPDESLRMAPVGEALSELLDTAVRTIDEVVGPRVEKAVDQLAPANVLLIENLRFDPGEKANDPEFAAALARLGGVYVNDAFGTAHRAAASVVGVTEHLPSYAGRLMERELTILSGALADPRPPFVVILGGAKVADKIGVIESLLERADRVLIGGGMANTFLAARGTQMSDSLVDAGGLEEARRLLERGSEKVVLPLDLVVADQLAEDAQARVVRVDEGVPGGWRALDIGPRTVELFAGQLADAGTVFWNGPMGVFEMEPFAVGTFEVARVLADMDDAMTIVGGGDSAAAVRAAGLARDIDWVSTGGGASLELVEGKRLPAVEALVGQAP